MQTKDQDDMAAEVCVLPIDPTMRATVTAEKGGLATTGTTSASLCSITRGEDWKCWRIASACNPMPLEWIHIIVNMMPQAQSVIVNSQGLFRLGQSSPEAKPQTPLQR